MLHLSILKNMKKIFIHFNPEGKDFLNKQKNTRIEGLWSFNLAVLSHLSWLCFVILQKTLSTEMQLFVGVFFLSLKCFIFSGKLLFISVHDLKRPISTTTQIPFRERVSMKHLPPNSPQPRNPFAPKHTLVQKHERVHTEKARRISTLTPTHTCTHISTDRMSQAGKNHVCISPSGANKILDLCTKLLLGFAVSPAWRHGRKPAQSDRWVQKSGWRHNDQNKNPNVLLELQRYSFCKVAVP